MLKSKTTWMTATAFCLVLGLVMLIVGLVTPIANLNVPISKVISTLNEVSSRFGVSATFTLFDIRPVASSAGGDFLKLYDTAVAGFAFIMIAIALFLIYFAIVRPLAGTFSKYNYAPPRRATQDPEGTTPRPGSAAADGAPPGDADPPAAVLEPATTLPAAPDEPLKTTPKKLRSRAKANAASRQAPKKLKPVAVKKKRRPPSV